jgi:DNA-binding PadR family transcriptional regulator
VDADGYITNTEQIIGPGDKTYKISDGGLRILKTRMSDVTV